MDEEDRCIFADAFIDYFLNCHESGEGSPPKEPCSSKTELKIDELFKLSDDNPEMLLDLILEIIHRDPPEKVLGFVVVGPLRIFLAERGESFIELVEEHAAHDPKFKSLLCKFRLKDTIPVHIWERIQACADR